MSLPCWPRVRVIPCSWLLHLLHLQWGQSHHPSRPTPSLAAPTAPSDSSAPPAIPLFIQQLEEIGLDFLGRGLQTAPDPALEAGAAVRAACCRAGASPPTPPSPSALNIASLLNAERVPRHSQGGFTCCEEKRGCLDRGEMRYLWDLAGSLLWSV